MKEPSASISVLLVVFHLTSALSSNLVQSSHTFNNCQVNSDWLQCTGPSLPQETANYSLIEWNVTNRISINRQDFKDITNLTGLRITGSGMMSIESGTFETMENLVNLTIAGTGISEISTLRGLDSLQFLNLSSNKFKKLDDVLPALTELPNLRELSLTDNEIRNASEKMVELMASLSFVDLTGNPLWCDCGLKALRPYILDYRAPKRRMLFIKTGYCYGPIKEKRVDAFMMRIYKMACYNASELFFSLSFIGAAIVTAGILAAIKEGAKRLQTHYKSVKTLRVHENWLEKRKYPGNGFQVSSPLLKDSTA